MSKQPAGYTLSPPGFHTYFSKQHILLLLVITDHEFEMTLVYLHFQTHAVVCQCSSQVPFVHLLYIKYSTVS